MPTDPNTYQLTVRPHRSEDARFEYVLSRPGHQALMSDIAYETYDAAKQAGDERGKSLGLTPSHTMADGGRRTE